MFINSRGRTSPAAIGKETGIDKSLVIHILETPRIHGHVTPIPNEYNRGHSPYSATRRGKKHLKQIRDQNTEEYAEVLEAWTEPESFDSLRDRKSTRLNSSHVSISYAVFCLKKKN